MKNKIQIVILLLTVLSACKKGFLDQKVLTVINEQSVFSDSTRSSNFVTAIYADANLSWSLNRQNGAGGIGLYAACDEGDPDNNPNYQFLREIAGGQNSSNVDKTLWTIVYQRVRGINILLKNRDSIPVSAALKSRYVGEVRFLRAWYYFALMKHYGGIPLVGDKIFAESETIDVPRSTYEATLNYIIAECDTAAALLPAPAAYATQDYGRANRGAALGLKSRALLYAASPLYNGGSIASDAEIAKLVSFPAASNERWKTAADAAEAVINLNQYSLHTSASTEAGFGFYEVFTKRVNSEYLFAYMRDNNKYVENLFDMPSRGTAATKCSPYQETVDAFGMKNGLPITDPASGYNAANPYVNRDPRFYHTIIFNGALRNRNGFAGAQPVFTYVGAPLDGLNLAGATTTGYYCYKMIDKNALTAGGSNSARCDPLMRYAEILLNAAEATNEYYGPTARVYDLMKQLRIRAGVDAGAGILYGLKTGMTKDEMRTIIRRERQMELAYEEQRYWDVRRWKIAEQTDNKAMRGMQINQVGANTYTYTSIAVRQHVFLPNMYLWPIPQAEITKSPALKQNPGY